MDGESVLEQVRSGRAPSEWNIWPLRRDYVRIGAIKWGLLGIAGFALYVPVIMLTIPSDFVGTGFSVQLFAIVLLIMLGAMSFGGVGIALFDAWRLRHASDYWLVITSDSFVKAEPQRVTQTPLENVANITLKGVSLPSDRAPAYQSPMLPFNGRALGFMNTNAGPQARRQRARGNASLAYRDSRDNKVVIVCTDDSFDQMTAIYEILRDRAARREDQLRRASYQAPGAQGRGDA